MIQHAEAVWNGSLKEGSGHLTTGTKVLDAPYNFKSRFEGTAQTNPEELIGAAHAGCFSMALSMILGMAGITATSIKTKAHVHLNPVEGGFGITKIELETVVDAPGLDQAGLETHTTAAKLGCPVSKALKAVEITLKASLA